MTKGAAKWRVRGRPVAAEVRASPHPQNGAGPPRGRSPCAPEPRDKIRSCAKAVLRSRGTCVHTRTPRVLAEEGCALCSIFFQDFFFSGYTRWVSGGIFFGNCKSSVVYYQ